MTNPNSMHSFVLVSFASLLGMLVVSIDFDLIIASPMGAFVIASRMVKGCFLMID